MKFRFSLVVGLLLWSACVVRAQENGAATPPTAPGYALGSHSDTHFAHELLRLNQVDLIAAEAKRSAGTASESLWKAELLLATWDEVSKLKSDRASGEQTYLAAMTAYLDSQRSGIDGVWALDHAKFVSGRLSEPLLNRMEYWSNNEKDRAALAPMAKLGDRLLKQAVKSLAAGMHEAEGKTPFDEATYTQDFNATTELEYYRVWAAYCRAMAMAPADPTRKALMTAGAQALGKWADDPQDNGVNATSLLLRGKMESEAGSLDAAAADLTRAAQSKNAPAWVQYQARYQLVVARLRAGTFGVANEELAFFKKTLPPNNLDAELSTEMLAYRVAWAEAETKTGPEKQQAEADALAILARVVARDPRFRELVYEQLAAQIPESAETNSLLPMQQLSVAYTHSQGQRGDTDDSRASLERAAAAAVAAHDNPKATPQEKLEATFLAGVTNGLLKRPLDAAKYDVEFAEMAPGDPRAKPLLDAALEQIGEMRKAAATAGKVDPGLLDLQGRALALATDNFHDSKWRYAQGRTLEDAGKLKQAAAIFQEMPSDDKNFLDARFRLVAIATAQFAALPATAGGDEMKAAATQLFDACDAYGQLLENPPATVDADALSRAKLYRVDIWLIETSTALNPSVKQPEIALDRLAKLDAAQGELSAAQKDAVLRYRIQAYQLTGQADKAFEVVQAYAKSQGKVANEVMRTFAYSTLDEITEAEKSDPQRARQLASYVVKLLDPLIASAAQDEAQKGTLYDYQKLRSDMLLRSGAFADSQALAVKLQGERPDDLFNYMIQARSLFAEAQSAGDSKEYSKAEDLFSRILPQLTNGSESFWEAWLRILQTKEILAGTDAGETIKKRLSDLRAGFGDKLGGDRYGTAFAKLVEKYGAQ